MENNNKEIIESIKELYQKGINMDECSDNIDISNLPSIYFKISSYPLPEIIFDSYQESLSTNKLQPKGWDKQGVWVGNNINRKKTIKRDKTNTKSNIIIKNGIDGTIHIITKQLNNIYETD